MLSWAAMRVMLAALILGLGLPAGARAQGTAMTVLRKMAGAAAPAADIGAAFRRYFALKRRLAAEGLEIFTVEGAVGFHQRLTAYLNPRALSKLPAAGRDRAADDLVRFARACEEIQAYYRDSDFESTISYQAQALLALALRPRV